MTFTWMTPNSCELDVERIGTNIVDYLMMKEDLGFTFTRGEIEDIVMDFLFDELQDQNKDNGEIPPEVIAQMRDNIYPYLFHQMGMEFMERLT